VPLTVETINFVPSAKLTINRLSEGKCAWLGVKAASGSYKAVGIPIYARHNVNRSNIRPNSGPVFVFRAAAAADDNDCNADLSDWMSSRYSSINAVYNMPHHYTRVVTTH